MGGDKTAEGVFGLLSNAIRIDVLRAVAVAQSEKKESGGGISALSFSEIYDRVEVDNTSKLSYHLGELTGTFLRKYDDSYSLTHAGERMIRFILAENFRPPAEFGPIETDGRCLYCGESSLRAVLHEQSFMVRCSACDRPATAYVVTPAQTRSRDAGALLKSLKRKQATEYRLVQEGVCPVCAGRVSAEVLHASDIPGGEDVPFSIVSAHECQQCLRFYSGPLAYGVAYHPASIAFHWEHGVDVAGAGMWELHEHVHEGRWTAEQVDTDPEEYRVVLRQDADRLRVFLDGAAQVIRTERVRDRTVD